MPLTQPYADNNSEFYAYKLGASQDVVVGAGSLQSTAFGADTKVIRINSTTACRILIGSNPTALATSALLPPNWIECLVVKGGDKIAVIQEAAAGKLNITELV